MFYLWHSASGLHWGCVACRVTNKMPHLFKKSFGHWIRPRLVQLLLGDTTDWKNFRMKYSINPIVLALPVNDTWPEVGSISPELAVDVVCLTSVILCLRASCFTFWHLWRSLALTGFCFSSCSHLWLLNGAGESPDFTWVPNSSDQIHLCRFGFGFYFWLMKIVIPALLTVVLVIFTNFFLPFFHSFPRAFFCF